ncbi:ATP-binding protein [Desulfobacterales bacterium HSG2]|nr:ATP-binding protein [Desulfobacterales bacterium HSG2]
MHYFKNFKGFSDVKINLFNPLTVLIGPNGSGKSNLIEAVELLSFLAQGGSLYEVTDINKDGKQEIRGGLQACPYLGRTNNFFLGFSAQIRFDGKKHPFYYTLKIDTKPLRIIDESLYLDKKMFFEVVPAESNQHKLRVRYNNFARGGKKPHSDASPMQSLLSQYRTFAIRNRKRKASEEVVHGIANYLHASFVFDPNPKLMRDYDHIGMGNQVLTKNGSNLSAVLYELYRGDKEKLNRILNWIQQIPNEPYEDFEFITVPQLNDVIFSLREKNTAFLNNAGILSDGTLRCLAVLTALETSSRGSRVVIEEFDNGLHPSRVGILVKAIEECCERRDFNVLVTSHNPATLNELGAKQLEGVVSCVYDDSEHAINLIPLTELPRYVELMERAKLGDLVTRRILDEYLAPDFEINRKKEVYECLRNL